MWVSPSQNLTARVSLSSPFCFSPLLSISSMATVCPFPLHQSLPLPDLLHDVPGWSAVVRWALPPVRLAGALVAALHFCRSFHYSGYPTSLKHPSFVCLEPPQWVHRSFLRSSSSRVLWKVLFRMAKPDPISEELVPGDETPFIILRRAISRLIVA